MALKIDLNRYFSGRILEDGRALYDSHGISKLEYTVDAEGSRVFSAKASDSFNFISHARLVIDRSGDVLRDFTCDCPAMRRAKKPCEHCAALLFAIQNEVPEFVFVYEPEAQPAAELTPATPTATPEQEAEAAQPQPQAERPAAPEVRAGPAPLRAMKLLFGHDKAGQEILWCPNETDKVFHPNLGIIGTMGTGKTQFAKSLIAQLYLNQGDNFDGSHPLGLLIFDYKGDYNETKTDFIRATGARVLKPYRLPFNPLALNPGETFKPLLPLHVANEFKDTISQIYNLGEKQKQLLLDCIMTAYEEQGIKKDNPATWLRRAPTIDQVYAVFKRETEGRTPDKLTNAFDKLHDFCLFEADPAKAMSLDELLQGVVVIDISGYSMDIQSTIIAITLNQFYARMLARGHSRIDGKLRQLSQFIMVDEADSFMDEKLPSLRRVMKEGREFGVGVILSTQSLKHFSGEEDNYSRYVLTWVVHNVGDLKERDVEYIFKLPPKSPAISQNYAAIKALVTHESVVKLGSSDPLTIRNKAFYQLYNELQ